MALEIKTKVIRQSRDGRDITAVDGTGLESMGRVTGYGPVNGNASDIIAHHFVVSRYNAVTDYRYTVNPTSVGVPTNTELAEGHPIRLTTEMFKTGSTTAPTDIFSDGVLDFNMYVEFSGMTNVVITEGLSSVVFPSGVVGNFNTILKYDAIIVGGNIYPIDKSKDTNGGTVFYIVGEFKDSATSFNGLYRDNIKILLNTVSKYYHAFATKKLKNNIDSPEWERVNTALSFISSADIWFENEDYAEAHEEIEAAYKILRRYTC